MALQRQAPPQSNYLKSNNGLNVISDSYLGRPHVLILTSTRHRAAPKRDKDDIETADTQKQSKRPLGRLLPRQNSVGKILLGRSGRARRRNRRRNANRRRRGDASRDDTRADRARTGRSSACTSRRTTASRATRRASRCRRLSESKGRGNRKGNDQTSNRQGLLKHVKPPI